MKKQLLFGSALLAAVAVNAQTNKARPFISTKDPSKLSGNAALSPSLDGPTFVDENFYIIKPGQEVSTMEKSNSVLTPTVTWNRISGSMNIYGMLVSESKPLQYNPNINAVSFIHRKSATYVSTPFSTSGTIVGMISTNWGATWDSTTLWASDDNIKRARYPQGALRNSLGNTNPNNAYFVASGPITSGSGWIGNWYASKSVTATPKNQAIEMQDFATVPTNTAIPKHEFSRLGFASTNDEIVRSVGMLNTGDGNTFALLGRRGATVVKGTFNAGVPVWTGDTIICDAAMRTDNAKTMNGTPRMAWNSAGTVGYMVFIGLRNGATGTKRGWQPIVYKTTNSGLTWSVISGIDFDSQAYDAVKKPLPAIWSSTTANTASIIPQFNESEGMDVTVDKNNKLHIFTTLVGSGSPHVDSVTAGYTFTFTNYPADRYDFAHQPGQRPYLYDFVGDGSAAWTYSIVDSMSTEGMSGTSGEKGYLENPWNEDANAKVTIDARLQMSRTPSGDGIVYSWTESDTNATNFGKKYNNKPDLKVRHGFFNTAGTYTISSSEWNISAPPINGTNGAVNSKAWFHYQSPICSAFTTTGNINTVRVPFTISNSSPLDQLGSNNHYYATNTIDFIAIPVGISENSSKTTISSLSIFPNPASNNANVSLSLIQDAKVTISVVNTLGQVVSTSTEKANAGKSNFNIGLNGIAKGIYFVNVKAGTQTATTKLIVE